jgi:hypothetical protein
VNFDPAYALLRGMSDAMLELDKIVRANVAFCAAGLEEK